MARLRLSAAALLLLCHALAVVAKKEVEAKEDRPTLSPAEIAHKRKFFSIGEGFEGSASDWTEYAVWLVGVIGVFYYMANPNARRNMHAVVDDDEHEDDVDELAKGPQPRGDADAALFGHAKAE